MCYCLHVIRNCESLRVSLRMTSLSLCINGVGLVVFSGFGTAVLVCLE
jgi:hypothetical protein